MKAMQIRAPGDAAVIDLPVPEPRPGEVRLRIQRVGYCGTDLSTFRGVNPLVSYPRVPGHELSGIVDAIGPDTIDPPRIGSRVLVVPYMPCGACSACRKNRPNCCRANQTLGVQCEGGMAEYLCVPAAKIMEGDRLDFEELAMVEPLTIGFHAVARGRIASGETVAVLGCGGVGLGVIARAAALGARVIGVDLDSGKLALAHRVGAGETIDTNRENTAARLKQLTGGEGPDVIVEAIGAPEMFRLAVDEVCFAGRVVYLGYAKAPVEYDTRLFVQKELDVLGSRNGLAEDFNNVIAHLQARRFPVAEAISQTVSIDEAPQALRDWAANPGAFTKVQIAFPAAC